MVKNNINNNKILVFSPDDAFAAVRNVFKSICWEEFWVLYLNPANHVVSIEKIAQGGIDNVHVDKRLVFEKALRLFATRLILVHNHPSGNLQASASDWKLTKSIEKAAKLFDIEVLDHLIVFEDQFYSMFSDR